MKPIKLTFKIAAVFVAISVCLLIGYMIALSGGADFREYPYERANRWICVEPEISLDFSNNRSTGCLKWSGEEFLISVGMRANSFQAYQIDALQEEVLYLEQEKLLFAGEWRYEGRNLIVTINQDNIFDGVYTKLIFNPQ